MQDNDERLGTRYPIKPAVMGFPADKVTCRMQTFECDPFDLLGNAPYSNPPKSSPEKGEKSRREQQIFNCRKQWIFLRWVVRKSVTVSKMPAWFRVKYIKVFVLYLFIPLCVETSVFCSYACFWYFDLFRFICCPWLFGQHLGNNRFSGNTFGTTQGKSKICTEFEDLAIFQSKSFFFVWRFYREKHKFCCWKWCFCP